MTDIVQALKDKPVLSLSSAAAAVGAIVWFVMWANGEFAHAADVKAINDGMEKHERADAAAVRMLNQQADMRAERTRLYNELRSLNDKRDRMATDVRDLETRQAVRGGRPDPADSMIIKSRQADIVKTDAEILEAKRALNVLAQPK